MPNLAVAAIHNGELPESPAAKVLANVSVTFPDAVVREISEQPEIQWTPDKAALKRWAGLQWSLERRWRKYLDPSGAVMRGAAAKAGEIVWRLRLASNASFAARAWRTRQVEAFVGAKHQRAWSDFLQQSDAKTLLVLESDAVWKDSSAPDLLAITRLLDATTAPAYVNIAGGLEMRQIGIEHLSEPAQEHPMLVQMTKPVTNTSCAYGINRLMARQLVDHLAKHPEHGELGIDWLFNAVFLDAQSRGEVIECWHAQPPALGHGSLTGVTESWHPGR